MVLLRNDFYFSMTLGFGVSKQGSEKQEEQLKSRILELEAKIIETTEVGRNAQSRADATSHDLEIKAALARALEETVKELQTELEDVRTKFLKEVDGRHQ